MKSERKLERLFVRLLTSKKYDVSNKKKKKQQKASSSAKNKTGSETEKTKSDSVEIELEMTETPSAVTKPKSMRKATREIFDEFCSNTTIHGIKYLNRTSWTHKLVWMLVYAFSIWFCGFLVLDRYQKWVKDPVIISFDTKFESISEVPFPAVTIWYEKHQKKIEENF